MPKDKKHLEGLAKFAHEPTYQQQVDKQREQYGYKKDQELAALIVTFRDEKDRLNQRLGEVNLQLEALSQLMIDRLENNDINKVSFVGLGTFFMTRDAYSSIKDRVALEAWVEAHNHQQLYQINWQSLNSLVKSLLEANEPAPDGVEVFIKTNLNRRKPNEDLVGSKELT